MDEQNNDVWWESQQQLALVADETIADGRWQMGEVKQIGIRQKEANNGFRCKCGEQ